jgi:hypothetical protein
MKHEPIKLEVSLGPNGLTVHLPSGRTLNVSATESGARFLEQMLKDAEAHQRYNIQQRGYIGAFPTQEIVALWEREERNRARLAQQAQEILASDAQAKAEARERTARAKAKQAARVWEKRGIDTSKIKINI